MMMSRALLESLTSLTWRSKKAVRGMSHTSNAMLSHSVNGHDISL